MAIAFVTSGTAVAASGGDPAITLGATPELNDLILCVGTIADNDSVDQAMSMTTAGYTLVPSTEVFADSGVQDLNIAVFYKFANGSESTLTFNGLGGSDAACCAVAQVFRGVDLSTPFDVTSVTASNLGGFVPNPPSIDFTSAIANVAIVVAVGSSHTEGIGSLSATPPTSYTGSRANQADTSNGSAGMAYRLSSFADPADPGTWAHDVVDNADYASVGITMALRAASTAATLVPPRRDLQNIMALRSAEIGW